MKNISLSSIIFSRSVQAYTAGRQQQRSILWRHGGMQFLKQLVAAMFVAAWNIISTTIILLAIRVFIPLRMPEEQLIIGDRCCSWRRGLCSLG
ncbi:ammonium transporter 2 [Prunus yedoensis var. nudiflora]|uniref:Ammonium transporter 2 n=1 Tax=Prunus yedoensis var. nudiflora TaxID=2094558 RepID=A0A314Z751_PRUYE|nr:ammonium transporter 2 [Prunus yedoensis var. nudiflora]